MRGLLVAGWLAAVAGCGGGEPVPVAFEAHAERLAADYQARPMEADKLYKDQRGRLIVTLNERGVENDQPRVVYRPRPSAGAMIGVSLRFADPDEAARVPLHQKVVVEGTCKGMYGTRVNFADCVYLGPADPPKPPPAADLPADPPAEDAPADPPPTPPTAR